MKGWLGWKHHTMAAPRLNPRPTRRTRIVCISDTHNSTVRLPKGDVLIHAGDLTNQGTYSELSSAVEWLEKAPYEAKIVIAGNHDITLDRVFYSEHGSTFHNQNPQDPAKCLSLLTSSPFITYLQHSSATIRLTHPKGPGTEFTIFGSPYSPRHGTWAFSYDRADHDPGSNQATTMAPSAAELWAAIPQDVDILLTHTPPYGHCDGFLGCQELRKALAEVRPRLHVCGHLHQSRGVERVKWHPDGFGTANCDNLRASVERWQDPSPDPASAKISLVDLTARGGKRALDFHDSAMPPGSQIPALPDLMRSLDRRETCVINCAIVATSWPHLGGKRFNKPIVVDLDLPVWR
ncbi:Metallo-dependent phosphatase [Canariomyces notabilis]|uniref:Metallo-dependent phosphatase n=1 Tax=Canariomyces notabilis TaxID=2074819 RepID=A0AAN6TI13_9PEZI|nr:Metallo-dependent phosphatase [Canariomyces arenarius]